NVGILSAFATGNHAGPRAITKYSHPDSKERPTYRDACPESRLDMQRDSTGGQQRIDPNGPNDHGGDHNLDHCKIATNELADDNFVLSDSPLLEQKSKDDS